MNTALKAFLAISLSLPLSLAAAPRSAAPFTDAEIDALLAPVALYPDSVLSHVLIAATVPEDVEEAAEWSRRHPDLEGQAAVDAVAKKDWDPSVKALVAFPDVLERMDEDPEWTEDLGVAFLEQEATVMDRVQYLRDRADEAGTLDKVEHVRVVREREYIYLEPAVDRVVYVPYYDPWYVYGAWWWPYYPPHRWAYWGGYPVHHYHGSTFYWGVAFHLGPSYYYSRFNWPHRHVVVARPHRHYAPSPGYSGRSSMRRPDRWQGRTTVRDGRRADRDSGWRNHETRRPDRDSRSHDQRQPRADHPGYRSERRNAEQVRDGLSQRRESRGRSASAHDRQDAAHERRDERRQERQGGPARGHEQREDNGREPRRDRQAADERREAPHEARRQSRPQEERGGWGREERRESRESRDAGARGERPHGGGREMSRGQAREQGRRQEGRGRRER